MYVVLKVQNQNGSQSGYRFFKCAKHGTNLASESLATGFYRQV